MEDKTFFVVLYGMMGVMVAIGIIYSLIILLPEDVPDLGCSNGIVVSGNTITYNHTILDKCDPSFSVAMKAVATAHWSESK